MARTIANLNIVIGGNIKGLQKSLRKAERSLAKTSRRISSIGDSLTKGLSIPVLGVGVAALHTAANFEKLELGLASMMGSTQAAREEMEKLREVAQAPGIAFEQAVEGSLRLQAVGISAESARETLSSFANALAAAGKGAADLDGVTLALSQIVSKGKVSAEEINQIAERVPQIRTALIKAFGTAEGNEINKALEAEWQRSQRLCGDHYRRVGKAAKGPGGVS